MTFAPAQGKKPALQPPGVRAQKYAMENVDEERCKRGRA